MGVPLRLRRGNRGKLAQVALWAHQVLRLSIKRRPASPINYSRNVGHQDLQILERNAQAVFEPRGPSVDVVRRPRYLGLRKLVQLRNLPGRHGRKAARDHARPDRPRRQLRAKQLSMGHAETTSGNESRHIQDRSKAEKQGLGGGRSRNGQATDDGNDV